MLSGSLPPGLPADAYAQLVPRARSAVCRSIVDAEGAALRAARWRAGPAVAKPNAAEAAALLGAGRSTTTRPALLAAAAR